MEPITIGILALIGMAIAIALGIPIGAAIGIIGIGSYWMLGGLASTLKIVGSVTADTLTNREMATIPLFLLMGGFATVSGISSDLFRLAYAFFGHYRGGLAVSTVFGCAGFGAVCGSSAACAATMTQVALPEMRKRNYKPSFAAGSVAAAGTLGVLIPPSIAIILYAYLTQTFVLDLFAAALIPALLTVALYSLAIGIVVRLDPKAGPAGERVGWAERWKAIKESWAAIMLAGLVAGGIYSGTMYVSEAAAAGAIFAVLISIFRRRLSIKSFFQVLQDAASATGMIYMIIVGASVFAYVISVSTLPEVVTVGIKGLGLPPIAVILILLLIYIVTGSIFESYSALVLTIPFVFPLVVGLGYDPIWWGIMMVLKIEIGQITPPIGLNLFIVKGLAPDVPIKTIYKGILPFLCADVFRVLILAFFPILSLWLPRIIR